MKSDFFILLFMSLLMGYAPMSFSTSQLTPTSPPSADGEAQQVLINYFDLLNASQYAEADAIYGGDYEQLKIFSMDIDPSDHVKLWSNACELAGLRYLKVRTAMLKSQVTNTYFFQVEFNNPDGSLFVLGPCCGADETEMPPVLKFDITVIKNAKGKFLVTNLPPYVP